MCVVLNMGTSSQLILMGTAADSAIQLPPSVLELPYFNGTNILVAASLNGGNVLSIFMTTLTTWLNDLGVQPPSKDEMFDIVIKKGLDYTSKQYSEQREEIPKLTFLPTFFGERHNPTCKGSVYNIGTNTVNIGEVFAGLCQGLIKNLLDMMPLCLLQEFGVSYNTKCPCRKYGICRYRSAKIHISLRWFIFSLLSSGDSLFL